MKRWLVRLSPMVFSAAAMMAVASSAARAQDPRPTHSQRGQPKTPFAENDFAKLRFLEGDWVAQSPGERPLYERYRILDDSTMQITYYRDPSFTQPTGTGRIYLTVGRVYTTFGAGRWGATHIDASGAYFIPQVNAHNSFAWAFQNPNAWTITMRSGLGGTQHVMVYQLTRLNRG